MDEVQEMKTVSAEIPLELWVQVREYADQHDRSMASVIRLALQMIVSQTELK